MDELLFPLAAVSATFLIMIPALTVLSRAALAWKRTRTNTWASFGSESIFAHLIAPTLIPTLWLTSSALHQSEPMSTQASCLVTHTHATTCSDAVLLLSLLLGGMLVTIGFRAWRERPQIRPQLLGKDAPSARRVARIIAENSALYGLRVLVARQLTAPVFTIGWIRPRVMLDACFVADVDDEMIRATLLHERAHVVGFDTLRGFIARVCLSMNPVGWLLAPDFQRWQCAREAQCDGMAVHQGGEPLALAEGIIRAARFQCSGAPWGAALLCGHDAATLKLRLALLLDGPPRPTRTLGHVLLGVVVILALVLPHLQGTGVLEHFHFEVERLFN